MTFPISVIAWAAIMITFGFIWSRRERRKMVKAEFIKGLKGHEHKSYEELRDIWNSK